MIGTPENFRVHWVWPSKYKGKWCFSSKCSFSETDHHTALKLVPLWLTHLKMSACTEFGPLNTKESDVLAQNVVSLKQIIIQLWLLVPLWLDMPENFRVHWVWPSKYKGKWCFSPKCGFSETDHHTALKLYHCDWHSWKPQVHWVWPSKYKGKWCFSPKCGFSETDHHTALKSVSLWLAHLKTSGALSLAL